MPETVEKAERSKKYRLKEVCIRLAEGHSLYSDKPLSDPSVALDVMRKELSQYDREVLCVVNLNTKLKPINFHIVSVGSLNQSVAATPNIVKSGILSNAASFMLLHNHPSGDTIPSQEDLMTTRRVIEAGKLIGIPLMDHIIVGSNENYRSMRQAMDADFENNQISMTAEDILRVGETTTSYGKGENKTMADETRIPDANIPDWVKEAEAQMAQATAEGKPFIEPSAEEEISIKFGKGLAENFTSKDGKEYTRIKIPNQDPADHTPWASFVLPANHVHENKFSKSLWAKISADETTIVSKPQLVEQDADGKNIWQDVKTKVPNTELKAMVEAYKTRASQARQDVVAEDKESALGRLDQLAKDTAAKVADDKPKTKAKAKTKCKDESL